MSIHQGPSVGTVMAALTRSVVSGVTGIVPSTDPDGGSARHRRWPLVHMKSPLARSSDLPPNRHWLVSISLNNEFAGNMQMARPARTTDAPCTSRHCFGAKPLGSRHVFSRMVSIFLADVVAHTSHAPARRCGNGGKPDTDGYER